MSMAGASASAPSSSSVLEFICLYTHDLRRKQKRWEDGRLKFHSFNNRVMVYDDRGGYVGDMHWRRDYDFGEGEEVQLERGGVIVQVQDLVHRSEQDLSELIDKRAKEKEERQLQAVARAAARNRGPTSVLPPSMPQPTPRPVPSDHFQLRHRPLHQLIGTPKGQYGRAHIPQETPYESRQQQNAESPDDRAAKRRKYEDERAAKKGHAQALFGQTLTLSATPTSSMPARYRSRPEPSSSIPVDDEQRDTGQQFGNALREQPKSSAFFNHSKGDAVSSLKATKKATSIRTANQSRSLAPDPRRKRATIPANAEIIDAEDPIPPPSPDPPTAMPGHVENRTVNTAAKAATQSKPSLSRQALDRNALPRSLPTTAEKKKQTHRNEEARQSKTASSAVARPADSLSSGTIETSGPSKTPRKSDRPVTELRLKSTKRRGLLTMSDRPRETVRARSSNKRTATPMTCDDIDQAGAQPAPASDAGEPDGASMDCERPTVSKASFESGDYEDPFRSPSPRPEEQIRGNNGPDLADNRSAEDIPIFQQEEDLDAHFEAYSPVEAEESIIRPPDVLEQTTASASSPQGRIHDPYRIPSSSPEKEPQAATEHVFGSPGRADVNTGDSRLPADTQVDEETSRSKGKIVNGTRRKRKTRRNIVLDDDDESETILEAVESGEPVGANEIVPESSQEDVPPKRAKSPAKTTRRRKRKSSVENEAPELDADEELPTKRRAPARKARRRRVVSESPPGSSQEPSEREQPAKTRKKKATKASEGRPRLTKLKKSVKSRELVGFDLSAFNVPLGLRGIGVPFSILSSPADAPTQRKASQNATQPEPYLQAEVDDDGPPMHSDASKARVPIKETSEVSVPTRGSTNSDELRPDQAKPVGETIGEPRRCTTETPSPEKNPERPQSPTWPGPSLENKGSEKQEVTPVASTKQSSKKNVDSAGADMPSFVDISMDMPCQGDAPGLVKQSSSMIQAPNPSENKPLKQQPSAQASHCELPIIESETKLCAEDDALSTTKTQNATSKLSRRDSNTSESAPTDPQAPASDGGDQPEVEEVPPAVVAAPPPRRTVGLRRTASAVRSVNNLQIEKTPPAELPVGTTAAEDSTKPIARIVNPATRGRKAALKAHAAGQAPQRILPPTQPPLLVPVSTADLAMTPIEEPKKEPERPKKKMQFPGFQSARGEGPWSREAFDLLESGRPA